MAIDKYSLKDGSTRYRATTYISGQRIQKRGFERKKDAQKWIDKTRAAGKIPQAASYNQIADRFLEEYQPTVKPSTYFNAVRFLKHSRAALGTKPIAAITVSDVQRLANRLAAQYVDVKTPIKYTRMVFDYARRNNIIADNPARKIRMPRTKKEPHSYELWTPEELARFLEASKADKMPSAYPFFRLLAYTGIRRGEILALEKSDRIAPDLLEINKTYTVDENGRQLLSTPKTKASSRVIALDRITAQALDTLENTPSEKYFPESDGIYRRALERIEAAAALPHMPFHGFRHLHCTQLIQAGAPIKDVQARLGHSDIQTTLNIYAHANKDNRAILDIIERYSYTDHYTD